MSRKTLERETYFRQDGTARHQEGQLLENTPTLLLEFLFPDISTFEQLASPDQAKFVGDVRWVDVPGLTGMIVRVEGKMVRIKEFGVQSLHGVNSCVAKHYESRVEGFCTLQGSGVMEKYAKAVQSRCGEDWTETLEGTITTTQLAGARIRIFSDGSIQVLSGGQASGQASGQEYTVRPVVTTPGQSHGTRTTSETLLGLNWIGEIVRG